MKKLVLVACLLIYSWAIGWCAWSAIKIPAPAPVYAVPTITWAANWMSWSNAEFRDSQHRQLKSHCDLMSHSCWVEVRDFDWHRSDVVSDGYQVWMYIDGELDLQNRPFRKTADNFPCVSARGKPHNVINAGPDACDIQFWSASGGDNNDPIRVPTGGVK